MKNTSDKLSRDNTSDVMQFMRYYRKLFLNIDKKIMHQWKCRLRNIVLRLSICDVFTDEEMEFLLLKADLLGVADGS